MGRCGQVLAVDVYKDGALQFRFFSDGKNYLTWVSVSAPNIPDPGWSKRTPFGGICSSHPNVAVRQKDMEKIHHILGTRATYYTERQQAPEAISRFISDLGWERRSKAWERKQALMKRHFAMFPEYPSDLARFCEDSVFQESILYVSKLEDGQRRAQCRHCGKSFQVSREARPGGSGVCPKCGWPVTYKADWAERPVIHKSKVCIAHRFEGQLLLQYVDVERTIYSDSREPQYHFSDYFKTLFLVTNGKPVEYAYAWCQAPYCGYDWRRLPNGSECLGESFVYTPNLREVFGARFYNVDLRAGLTGLRRPLSFRRLLNNFKNVPQAEYLMKAALPTLAAGNLPDTGARSLTELTGLGKHFLPAMRESQATFQEIKTIAAQRGAVPEDLRRLCALRLDGDSLLLLKRTAHFNAIGRILRYVQAQKEASIGQVRRNKLPYFLRLYRDYLDMAQELKSDMTERAILEPRNLKERHDLLASRVNELKSRPDDERFQKAVDEGLYWWVHKYANDDYCVVYPMKRSDLTTEGQVLNHCVGLNSYFERHIRGHQMVFFIRRVSAPDKPYFTAEIDVDTGRIIQLYGFGNCSAPKEVRGFTEGFARAVVRWWSVEQKKAA